MTREQLIEFTYTILISKFQTEKNIREEIIQILPNHSLEKNIKISAVRILNELGYRVIFKNNKYTVI